MSGAAGAPKETATNTPIRSEIEQLTMFNHHREEVCEVRTRWRQAMERRVDRTPGGLDFLQAAD